MASTSCERQVDLNMYMHDVKKMLIYDGTTGHINPHFYKHGSAVVRNDNREFFVNTLNYANMHYVVILKGYKMIIFRRKK